MSITQTTFTLMPPGTDFTRSILYQPLLKPGKQGFERADYKKELEWASEDSWLGDKRVWWPTAKTIPLQVKCNESQKTYQLIFRGKTTGVGSLPTDINGQKPDRHFSTLVSFQSKDYPLPPEGLKESHELCEFSNQLYDLLLFSLTELRDKKTFNLTDTADKEQVLVSQQASTVDGRPFLMRTQHGDEPVEVSFQLTMDAAGDVPSKLEEIDCCNESNFEFDWPSCRYFKRVKDNAGRRLVKAVTSQLPGSH